MLLPSSSRGYLFLQSFIYSSTSCAHVMNCAVLSCFSSVHLCAALWTVAHQAPLSLEFSMQEYLSELPCPPPGDLPVPGIEPASLASPAFALCYFLYMVWGNVRISFLYSSTSCAHVMNCAVLSCFSRVHLCAALRTVAHQAPLSLEFSMQEYSSELPCPPPGDLPDPGIEPASLASPALADKFFTTSAT